MDIKMIPGPRNEELILKVREAIADYRADENSAAISDLSAEYGLAEVFDALYYACENREEMLQDQTESLLDWLYCEETDYYISRMIGIRL